MLKTLFSARRRLPNSSWKRSALRNAALSLVTVALASTLTACLSSGSGESSATIDDKTDLTAFTTEKSAIKYMQLPVRINAGGAAYVDASANTWLADTGFNTGTAASVKAAIDGTTSDPLYQSNRFDVSTSPELSYALTVPNGDYGIRLHFAETWSGAWAVGKRVFGIKIEGQSVESGLDVFAAAGANRALVKSYTANVTDGRLQIDFVHEVQNPIISAIEVVKLQTTAIRVNAGGGSFVDGAGNPWLADVGFNTGSVAAVTSAINSTTNDRLYQSNRYDPGTTPELTYAFDVPNGDYRVNLHFAETWSGAWAIGKRVFGINIEGQSVESALDIFASAGANTAMVKSYTTKVSDGRLQIGFIHRVQNPEISGIEILSFFPTSSAGSGTDGSTTTSTTSDGTSTTGQTTDTSTSVNAIPVANTDSAAVNDGVAAVLNVLANDTGLTDSPVTLTISAKPSHGAAYVRSDNMVVYTAASGYAGSDSFTYRIADSNGDTALATVSINVTCTSCPVERVLTISWNPNSDTISGYRVFRGPTADQATVLLSDLPLNSGLIDPTAPKAQYRSFTDLGLSAGQQTCFRVRAYTDDAVSDYSQAVCGVI